MITILIAIGIIIGIVGIIITNNIVSNLMKKNKCAYCTCCKYNKHFIYEHQHSGCWHKSNVEFCKEGMDEGRFAMITSNFNNAMNKQYDCGNFKLNILINYLPWGHWTRIFPVC
jgi:hypothetical protein